jgi:hypothetical protein
MTAVPESRALPSLRQYDDSGYRNLGTALMMLIQAS